MNPDLTAHLEAAERNFRQRPRSTDARQAFAWALQKVGEEGRADALVRAGLPAAQRRSIEAGVAAMLAERYGLAAHKSGWRYRVGGTSNIAFIHHERSPDGPLYTKVVGLWRPHVRQEVALNRALVHAAGPWETVTPRIYDVRVVPRSRLALITGEFFAGVRVPMPESFEALVGLLSRYASPEATTSLRAALAPHERPGMPSWLDRSWREWPWIGGILMLQPHKISVRKLRWLDHEAGSRLLLNWITRRLQRLPLPVRVRRLGREVAGAWLQGRARRRFDPARDFTLAHGDYGAHNVMATPTRDRWAVFDFNSLMAAPASIDLARILGSQAFGGSFMQSRALPHLLSHAPDWLWNATQRLLFLLLLLSHKLWFTRRELLAEPELDLEPLLLRLAEAIGED